MDDTQAQEAESLAEWLEGVSEAISARRAAALLRSQAARIAELERELARMREPLSDEQIDALRVESAKAMQSLADRGLIPAPEVCDEDLVRRVEAAHGITKTGGGV